MLCQVLTNQFCFTFLCVGFFLSFKPSTEKSTILTKGFDLSHLTFVHYSHQFICLD